MPLILLALFIGVPIAEIAVFIQAGEAFGLWPTLAAVILTAVAGTALLRVQGLAVMRRATESMQRGEMPVAEVFAGLCLVIAGALLLTPGFITDLIGLLLFVPGIRTIIGRAFLHLLARHGRVQVRGTFGGRPPGGGPRHGQGGGQDRRPPDGAPVIEGEYTEVDGEPDRTGGDHRQDGSDGVNPDSPWRRTP